MICISDIQKTSHGQKIRLKAKVSISPSAAKRWYEESQKAEQFKDASFIVEDYLEHISEIQELWFETDKI